MRLLLISEGRHELGRESAGDGRSALRTLVLRIAGRPWQCDLDRITNPEFRSTHGKGPGYFKKAVRCIRVARDRATTR